MFLISYGHRLYIPLQADKQFADNECIRPNFFRALKNNTNFLLILQIGSFSD